MDGVFEDILVCLCQCWMDLLMYLLPFLFFFFMWDVVLFILSGYEPLICYVQCRI